MDDRETRRRGYPLTIPVTIPDALLQSEAMWQACAARNFQEIFRLVNRRTGSSYADMAAAIGKMTSSRVSDIIRGQRVIQALDAMGNSPSAVPDSLGELVDYYALTLDA